MDAVFDAQFRIIKDAFAREDIELEVCYTPKGEVDYVYQAGRLLAREADVGRLNDYLPGIARSNEPSMGDLAVLRIDGLERGQTTVPEALDLIDGHLGADSPALSERRVPMASPNHLLHITRLCSAVEPEVPSGYPGVPWPAVCAPAEVEDEHEVSILVCDTGLLDDHGHPWLDGVTGETDPLGPSRPSSGLPAIDAFSGHGTFVAGAAKCMAPRAKVHVARVFPTAGGALESTLVGDLDDEMGRSPDIVNVSAGMYTRDGWPSLGFETFHERYPDVVLVAAAGNDATDRELFPAAYPWAISVGALGLDQRHRAWFSNYGGSVDVYALGEGHVNAYATGEYTYREPPKRPSVQTFDGMARWDGTSFSAPMVAGLIAARMRRTGESAAAAAQAVLAAAGTQAISGVGPALFPCDAP